MSVFKIEKNGNYTVMSNYHLRDRNLSYKAKGLLSFMLSLPEDWDYSMSGLEAISKESIKAIRNILQELEDNKYLVRTRMQNELGKFYYDYSIYEIPFDIDPYYQKGNTVKGQTEKGIQINTNIINTKEQIDKGDKTKSSFFTSGEHNPLTINLINRGYLSEDDIKIYYYDKMYDNLLEDDNSYRDLLIISDYVITRVIKNNFQDEHGKIITNKFGYLKESINGNIRRLNVDLDDLWETDDYNVDNLYDDINL
ncbi:MAG: hypothetical protein PHU45_04255 [Bacilli bacterium]|nr:hypothetical protein [Bacilli bacterium]